MNYKTSDLYFSAVLRTLGFDIVDVTKSGKRFYFHFGNVEDPDTLKNDYFNGKISADLKTFVEAIKELKTRIYDSSN